VAFDPTDTAADCLSLEGCSVRVASGTAPVGPPVGRVRRDLRLRPRRVTDPPLLLALPLAAALQREPHAAEYAGSTRA
jgi:hypothetical protein